MGRFRALLQVNKVRAHFPSSWWDEEREMDELLLPFWTAPGSSQQHSRTRTSGGQAGSQTKLRPAVTRTPFPWQGGPCEARDGLVVLGILGQRASVHGHAEDRTAALWALHAPWPGAGFRMREGKGILAC